MPRLSLEILSLKKEKEKFLLKPDNVDDLLEVIKIILKAGQEPEKTLVFLKNL